MKRLALILIYTAMIFFVIPFAAVTLHGTSQRSVDDERVKVYIADEDEVRTMKIGDYLTGVTAAEMPAEFPEEALKAQAVAARTYLINKKLSSAKPEEHHGADICTDSTHCKAWKSRSQLKESWGEDYGKNYRKMKNAVKATEGELVTYEGKAIEAVFHSISSGKTEAAEDVWGGEYPYLVSVDSEWDKQAPDYNSELVISGEDFEKTVKQKYADFDADKGVIGDFEKSPAGGLKTVTLGGVNVKGTEFRTLFGLRSTNVVITENNGMYYFSVKGYGHGVGMSQYGAKYMADAGSGYRDILLHYYTDTQITKS